MTVERRTVLRSAAWSVPIIAAAVAVPAQAASMPAGQGPPAQGCIEFTHTQPHKGAKSGTLYCTVGVKETCGTAAGPVTINVSVDGRTWSKVVDIIPAYRATGAIVCEFDGIPAGVPLEVVFQAFVGIGDEEYVEEVKSWSTKTWW